MARLLLKFPKFQLTGTLRVSHVQRNLYDASDKPNFDMENPFEKERHKCVLCRTGVEVDYKNVKLLSQFQSPYTGQIYGKHITGLCSNQQTIVEKEIKKAQSVGLMATYLKEPTFLKDPELFDVDNPIRSHRF